MSSDSFSSLIFTAVVLEWNGILNIWAGILEQVETSEEQLPKVGDLLDPYLDHFHLQGDKNGISIL